MKKGFTLVELSIVLVIIGLLIGGILVGLSLIETAKINALIRQIQQYDIAVSSFKSKYKGLPGDNNKFSPKGNSNNKVDCTGFCFVQDFAGAPEMANFWKHLSNSGFSPNGVSYSNVSASSIVPGIHVPKIDFKSSSIKGGVVVFDNIYYIAGFSTFSNSVSKYSPVFKPAQAMAIDYKLDDGKVTTGSVLGSTHGASILWSGQDCSATILTDYNVASDKELCALQTPILSLASQ